MIEGGHSWNNGKHLHEVLVPVNYKYFLVHYVSYPIAMCFMETLHHQKIDIDRFKEQQIKCYYFVVLNWCFHGPFSPSSQHKELWSNDVFQDERVLNVWFFLFLKKIGSNWAWFMCLNIAGIHLSNSKKLLWMVPRTFRVEGVSANINTIWHYTTPNDDAFDAKVLPGYLNAKSLQG